MYYYTTYSFTFHNGRADLFPEVSVTTAGERLRETLGSQEDGQMASSYGESLVVSPPGGCFVSCSCTGGGVPTLQKSVLVLEGTTVYLLRNLQSSTRSEEVVQRGTGRGLWEGTEKKER